jgi:hypothetical protein
MLHYFKKKKDLTTYQQHNCECCHIKKINKKKNCTNQKGKGQWQKYKPQLHRSIHFHSLSECDQMGLFVYKDSLFPLVSGKCSVEISGHDLLARQKPHDFFALWDPEGMVPQLIFRAAWSVSWIQLHAPFRTQHY